MRNIRLVSRLDIKGSNVIKGMQMEGLRVVGTPAEMGKRYYHDGIDEIIFLDTVASLYQRSQLIELIAEVSNEIFVPMVVGGGIRSLDDVSSMLKAGADKVAINTQALKTPDIIKDASRVFGSQCIVLSVEAKRSTPGCWEAYCENGRQQSGRDVKQWVKEAEDLGAGEVLLTSVDNDGCMRGMDVKLCREVADVLSIPVIASGGVGRPFHVGECVLNGCVSAVATGAMLHFERSTIRDVKDELLNQGFDIRYE